MILPSMYTGAVLIPLENARLLEVPAGEPGDDNVSLGAGVGQDAEDLDVEFLDLVPAKTVRPLPFIPVLTSSRGRIGRQNAKPAPRMTAQGRRRQNRGFSHVLNTFNGRKSVFVPSV